MPHCQQRGPSSPASPAPESCGWSDFLATSRLRASRGDPCGRPGQAKSGQAECAWPAGERRACRPPALSPPPAGHRPNNHLGARGVPAATPSPGSWVGKGNFAALLRRGKLPLLANDRGAGGAGVNSARRGVRGPVRHVGNVALPTPGCRQCHIAYLRAWGSRGRCGLSDARHDLDNAPAGVRPAPSPTSPSRRPGHPARTASRAGRGPRSRMSR